MTTTVDGNINTWLSQIHKEYKTAISVDCVIFGYDQSSLKVLTINCDMPPFEGVRSLVGDLVRSDETLDDAAYRILKGRTGLEDVYLDQVKAFSDLGRHPLGRVITIAYYSLIKIGSSQLDIVANDHKLQWIDIKDIEELAFDHNNILNICHESLKLHLREKPIGFSLLPKKFSLKQLQHLYEIVLDIELDKRNFRRKLKNLDILIDINEIQRDVNHRPAKLYSFNRDMYIKKRAEGFHFEL